MSNARFITAIVFTSLVTASVVARLTLSRPAHASTPQSSCLQVVNVAPAANVSRYETWMNEQLAAGRTNFVGISYGLCAW